MLIKQSKAQKKIIGYHTEHDFLENDIISETRWLLEPEYKGHALGPLTILVHCARFGGLGKGSLL